MKKRILALLLALVMCFSCVFVSAADENDPNSDLTPEEQQELNDLMFKYYASILKLIEESYRLGGVSTEDMYAAFIKEVIGTDPKMVERAVKAATSVLDQNSFYLSQQDYENFYQHLEADYCGIGVIVSSMNGPITITGFPAEVTPARVAGLMPGDVIVSIDGSDVSDKNVNDIADLMKGTKGSIVKIGIKRGGLGEVKEFDVTRDDVEQNSVSYYFKDDYMYLKLSVFNDGCAKKVAEALKQADIKGVKKIILDLRDNGGGKGTEAFAMGSLFLPKNMLITTITYNDSAKNEVYYSDAKFSKKKYETAVLINENSASCSEMIAGALQDNGMGYLIGRNTFGKSTGQQVYPLNALDGYLKLTVSRYCTPSGNPIPDDGITPDKYIINKRIPLNSSKDIHKMTFARKLQLGDSGEDVIACKERLQILGYYVGATDNPDFDGLLENVVKKFQTDAGIYSYGVIDNATMLELYNRTNGVQIEEDTQLQTAVLYLKTK